MRRIAGVVLVLLFAVPAWAQTNTWAVLSPTPVALWEPANFVDCTRTAVLANPPGRAFSGSRIVNGMIYYWGGAHKTYPGNDVVAYDIAANRWTPDPAPPQCVHPVCPDPAGGPGPASYDHYPSLCVPNPPVAYDKYDPNCLVGSCNFASGSSKPVFRCAGGSRDGQLCAIDADCSAGSVFWPATTGTGTCTVGIPTPGAACPTCRPYAYHSYQLMAYNPVRAKLTLAIFSGLWEYDLTTRAFTWLARPPQFSGDLAAKVLLWDPVNERMLYINTGGSLRGISTFNYTTLTWNRFDPYIPQNDAPAYGAWDERLGKFVIAIREGDGGGAPTRWFLYDPTLVGAPAWTEISSITPVDLKTWFCGRALSVPPCWTTGLTYDATNQRIVALSQDATPTGRTLAAWAYDGVGNSWAKVTTTGGDGIVRNAGYPNQLHYDAGTGSLFLIDLDDFWSYGPNGTVRTWKITLDLGNPLPSHTPTQTRTPTQTPTPTETPTPIATLTPTPTCGGTLWQVGPGRTYTVPSAVDTLVGNGDCVYIDSGVYINDAAAWGANDLVLMGVGAGKAALYANGDINSTMPTTSDRGKGIWVLRGNNITVQNIEFACATGRTSNPHCLGYLIDSDNAAGIRLEGIGVTVRDCLFHDNNNGILGGPVGRCVGGANAGELCSTHAACASGVCYPVEPVGTVDIRESEFFRNGWGDGKSHNLYLSKLVNQLRFIGNYSHGAILGHLLKSRAANNEVITNRFMDESPSTTDCAEANQCQSPSPLDFPCRGETYVIGNVIHKGGATSTREVIRYGSAINTTDCLQPVTNSQSLYVVNNTILSDYPAPNTWYIRGYDPAFTPIAPGTPTPYPQRLVAKNNIFAGGGTPIVWPTSEPTPDVAANQTGDPQLVAASTFDYHLTLSSPAIDAGVDPGLSDTAYSLWPFYEYVPDRAIQLRPADDPLDVGAYAYQTVTPFATRTSTPVRTPSITPTWTSTSVIPPHCSDSEREAVFPMAASSDDGSIGYRSTVYEGPFTPNSLGTGGFNRYHATVNRDWASSTYRIGLLFWRWNTSRLPDGTAWPVDTVITKALVNVRWMSALTGARPIVLEWHHWGPVLDWSDWTNSSPTAVDPTYAGSLAATANGWVAQWLTHVEQVQLATSTGMRAMISDAVPPAEVNSVSAREYDFLTFAQGNVGAQLIVCYMGEAVAPTATPSGTATPMDTATPTVEPTAPPVVLHRIEHP